MKFVITTIALVLLPLSIFASGDHAAPEEDASTRFGPGKAVEAFNKEDGFKLSQKAMKNLGIGFEAIKGAGPWSVPSEAVVRLKQSTGVYRRYEGWISLVLVKVLKEENGLVFIQSADLEADDEVATKGSNYLRMTDSDLNAGTVDSCAH